MPIYAYKCAACGFAKDVLQKISDAPLAICPSCEKAEFSKQVTAAGFQLKGSGWYVTDFRGGNNGAKPGADGKSGDAAPAEGDSQGAGKSDTAAPANADSSAAKSETAKPATPAASTPAKPASAPATGSAG